jgi:UDP-N-acetylglucosamine--N-acetylmuramyl-(pentapeptide) pyrophosphoryl-undecaprenol N-acetylglucosamine transferase
MKIIFTGGHFSPAHAVIKKIQKDNEVLVIGRKYAFEGHANETLEYKICIKENIPFVPIKAGRLQRKFTRFTIQAAGRFPLGVYSALRILRQEKPDVVVTFGGYIGLSVAIAASLLHIPIVLHEQTQKAGLSARLISRFASVVLVSFETSKEYFKNKPVVLTGNPIREELFEEFDIPEYHSQLPLVYVTGGSTGAHAINSFVGEILQELTSEFFLVHQTGSQGSNDIEVMRKMKDELPPHLKKNYVVEKFFTPKEVSYLLKNASLVISRSGINTVLELMALGTVGLLIPLPFGQQNEQKENAILYSSTGLGEFVLQDEINGRVLLQKMRAMIKEQKNYRLNAKNALRYVHKDAVEKIIKQIYQYGRKASKRGSSNYLEKT